MKKEPSFEYFEIARNVMLALLTGKIELLAEREERIDQSDRSGADGKMQAFLLLASASSLVICVAFVLCGPQLSRFRLRLDFSVFSRCFLACSTYFGNNALMKWDFLQISNEQDCYHKPRRECKSYISITKCLWEVELRVCLSVGKCLLLELHNFYCFPKLSKYWLKLVTHFNLLFEKIGYLARCCVRLCDNWCDFHSTPTLSTSRPSCSGIHEQTHVFELSPRVKFNRAFQLMSTASWPHLTEGAEIETMSKKNESGCG